MKLRLLYFLFVISLLVSPGQAQVKSERSGSAASEKLLAGDPFDLGTGIYFRNYTDLFVNDTIPIDFVRTQRNMDSQQRSFGVGASTSYDMFIVGDVNKFSWVALVMADGSQQRFERISAGTGYADGVFENKASPTNFLGARISWNGKGAWIVKLMDGTEYTIHGCSPSTKRPGQCAVTEMRNSNGERLTVKRDGDGNILQITSPHGRKVSILNDSKGRIMRASDDEGHWIIYSYDVRGCLIKAMNWRGEVQWFTYDANLNMVKVREQGPGGRDEGPYQFSIENHYDEQNRLVSQQVSNGDFYEAKYTNGTGEGISRAEVRDRHGLYICDFNPTGYVIREQYTGLDEAGWTLDYFRDTTMNAVFDIKLVCIFKRTNVGESHLPTGMTQTLGGTGEPHKAFVSELCERLRRKPKSPRHKYPETNKSRVASNEYSPGAPS